MKTKDKLYRLNFTSKAQWQTVRNAVFPLTEGEYPDKSVYQLSNAQVFEGGFHPIPATFDEDGNELTPATVGDKYEVDIVSDLDLDLNDYLVVTPPEQWHKDFSGDFELVTP